MAQCKGCGTFRPSERDCWDCMYCAHPTPICDQCYSKHTDDVHFAEFYPDLDKKRRTEKCGNFLDVGQSLIACERPWAHEGDHGVGDLNWSRGTPSYRW